jgi:hypothetical protein
MKKTVFPLLVLILFFGITYAQDLPEFESYQDLMNGIGPEPGMFDPTDGWTMGGMAGLIMEENPITGDMDMYAQIGFQPTFGMGELAIGLNITVTYDFENEEFRRTEYNESADYLKLIRFIRYGKNPRREGIYVKAGELDAATIGHGTIINRYKTNVDYENRRAGAQVNLNYKYWGLETFTNNMFLGEVIGVRAIAKPFANNMIPIVNDIAFGVTIATDSTAPYILEDTETWDDVADDWVPGADGLPDWDENYVIQVDDYESLMIVGVDMEIPVFRGNMLGLNFYADWMQMRDVADDSGAFSTGSAVGMIFNFKLTENNKLYLKIEQRYFDQNFIPGYFDNMYEIQRVQYSTDFPLLTKLGLLASLPDDGRFKGLRAEVALDLLAIFQVWGSFEDNYDLDDDGLITLGAGFKNIAGVSIGAEYTRRNINDGDLNDMFTLDERSIFTAFLKYKVNAFIGAGAVYRREWALNELTGEYEPVDSYSVGISYNTAF